MDLDSFIITVFCLVDDALQSCLEGARCAGEDHNLCCQTARSSPWK